MDDSLSAPGGYLSPGGIRYRVCAVPGRAAMRVVERHVGRDVGRWRVVAALPVDAARTEESAVPAFAGVTAPGEVGMPAWLAALEAQREDVKRLVLGLVDGYDAERLFSVDDFDRDYDVDLAHCADAALPLLVALEDAIDTVRACLERERG